MGDGGSYLLGFLLSLVSIISTTRYPFGNSETFATAIYVPMILFSIPILYLMINDFILGGDKWEENFILGNIDKYISKRLYNYILRIAGAYGLIQVLAQDIGIKTGLNQRNFSQSPLIQFLILFGGAYSFTGFRGEAMLSTFLYLVLKNNSSLNKVSDVCFESV